MAKSLSPRVGDDERQFRERLLAPLVPHVPDLTGRSIGSGYEVVRPLGAGGSGTVYLIRHQTTGSHFAAKFFPCADQGMATMQAELSALRNVDRNVHPNVIRFRMPLDHPDQLGFFLVTDLVNGPALSTWSSRGEKAGRATQSDVITWMLQLLDALMFLHPTQQEVALALGARAAGERWVPPSGVRMPMVHWDVKPANLMIEADATLVLVDFNVAVSLTGTASYVGSTPLYLDPAVDPGNVTNPYDPAPDLYAAGVTAYELLCGQLPFEHASPIPNIAVQPLTPCPRPGIDADLFAWAVRACRPDPADRFGSAAAMHDALVPIADRLQVPHEPCHGQRWA